MVEPIQHKLFLLLLISSIGVSCKKVTDISPDRLSGDTSIFVGTWEWSHTYHMHNHCEPGDLVTDTLTPETEGHDFRMDFFEEGRIVFYQDGIQVAERDLYITQFENGPICLLYDATKFEFKYHPDSSEMEIHGCVKTDSIWTGYFYESLFAYEPSCEVYHNYFIKL